jgi:hypothetical protein
LSDASFLITTIYFSLTDFYDLNWQKISKNLRHSPSSIKFLINIIIFTPYSRGNVLYLLRLRNKFFGICKNIVSKNVQNMYKVGILRLSQKNNSITRHRKYYGFFCNRKSKNIFFPYKISKSMVTMIFEKFDFIWKFRRNWHSLGEIEVTIIGGLILLM